MVLDFPSFTKMKLPIYFIILTLQACDTSITITGEDILYFENTEQLSITCTNDVNAVVQYNKNGTTLTTCVFSNGCSIRNTTFTVTNSTVSSEWRYHLESVKNFTTDLCGTYECKDATNGSKGPSDTVNVSYKDFDNNSFTFVQREGEVSITTACVSPGVLDDMEITWYTYNNGVLKPMSNEDLDRFNSYERGTPCPNVNCEMLQIQSFTFRLTFKEPTFSLSFVEIKIVHPLFRNKPLIWRSTTQYPVLPKTAPAQSGFDLGEWLKQKVFKGVAIIVSIIVGICGVVTLIVIFIRKKREKEKEKKEKRKIVSELPLFSSFDAKKKGSIADAMFFKHVSGTERKPVDVDAKFYVIADGELNVDMPDGQRIIGTSSGFVISATTIIIPTLDTNTCSASPSVERNGPPASLAVYTESQVLSATKKPQGRQTPTIEARTKVKTYMLPSSTTFEAFKSVKLLEMKSDSYINILKNNPTWISTLKGDFKSATVDGTDVEANSLTNIKVDGTSEGRHQDTENEMIIIEVGTDGKIEKKTQKQKGDQKRGTERAGSEGPLDHNTSRPQRANEYLGGQNTKESTVNDNDTHTENVKLVNNAGNIGKKTQKKNGDQQGGERKRAGSGGSHDKNPPSPGKINECLGGQQTKESTVKANDMHTANEKLDGTAATTNEKRKTKRKSRKREEEKSDPSHQQNNSSREREYLEDEENEEPPDMGGDQQIINVKPVENCEENVDSPNNQENTRVISTQASPAATGGYSRLTKEGGNTAWA